jgi:hypothetical protein
MVRTILNIVGIAGICLATLTLASTSYGKGGGKPGGGGKPSGGGGKPGGGGAKPGNGGKPHPGHGQHHHYHGHGLGGIGGNWDNGGGYGGGDVIDASSSAQEDTMQNVRFLRVRNETGDALKVFVQLEQGGKTFSWNFAPGANAYLAINGEKIASDRVYIWGQAGQKRWAGPHRTEGLTLVSQPYASEEIGTFTYTFNP